MSQIRNGRRTTGVAATTTKTDSANATIALMSREAMRTCKPPRLLRRLTVNLRGRTTTPDKRRGRTLSPGARGAKPLTHHGPLQRLLGAALCTDFHMALRLTDLGSRALGAAGA